MHAGRGDRRREGPSGHTRPKPAHLPLGCLSSGGWPGKPDERVDSLTDGTLLGKGKDVCDDLGCLPFHSFKFQLPKEACHRNPLFEQTGER